MKIFGFLKPEWRSMLLVVLLLIVQAACALALPAYTSALVDVGVQQGGIPSPAADSLSAQAFADLSALLDEEGRARLVADYRQDGEVHRLRWDILPQNKIQAGRASLPAHGNAVHAERQRGPPEARRRFCPPGRAVGPGGGDKAPRRPWRTRAPSASR